MSAETHIILESDYRVQVCYWLSALKKKKKSITCLSQKFFVWNKPVAQCCITQRELRLVSAKKGYLRVCAIDGYDQPLSGVCKARGIVAYCEWSCFQNARS